MQDISAYYYHLIHPEKKEKRKKKEYIYHLPLRHKWSHPNDITSFSWIPIYENRGCNQKLFSMWQQLVKTGKIRENTGITHNCKQNFKYCNKKIHQLSLTLAKPSNISQTFQNLLKIVQTKGALILIARIDYTCKESLTLLLILRPVIVDPNRIEMC